MGTALFALSLAALPLVQAQAADAMMASQVERPGGTYVVLHDLPNDPQSCHKACMDDDKCVAYTFVFQGFQGKKPRCWLKDAVTPTWKTGEECCVSGVKSFDGITETRIFDNITLADAASGSSTMGLDLCKSAGAQCGWPAAHAYCKSQGYSSALDFQVERSVPPTRAIEDGFTCNQKFCHRITSVTCGYKLAQVSD